MEGFYKYIFDIVYNIEMYEVCLYLFNFMIYIYTV